MLVGVCDFPSRYAFPPVGYGGIERWLWATAVGARASGADVHLLGPGWREDLGPEWTRIPVRLEDLSPGSHAARMLASSGYDLLIVGHEYPSLPAWRHIRETLGGDVATFQHDRAFHHAPDAFNGIRDRLYCYSPEMVDRYAPHLPAQVLAVHLGLAEHEPPAVHGKDLVWLGRIDEQKAPHIAVRAAQLLGRRIRMVGPIFDNHYFRSHSRLFDADHVEWVGELGGPNKTAAIHGATALIYTCARDYVEAGAAIFGEAIRAGTPVAALTWRDGTCAHAALCPDTGSTAVLPPNADDETAAQTLADVIARTDHLDASAVQDIGRHRFDPRRHFEALAAHPC